MDVTMCRCIVAFLGLLILMPHIIVSQDPMKPPERPEVFRSPQELRQYLKALNEYFAIVGRPRFGRSITKRSLRSMEFSKRGFGNFGGLDVDGDGVISNADLAYYSQYIYGN